MANRFWTGGTGNWDGTTGSSAHWGTSTGGGGAPASGPGASDVAIFDGASGGGTVTVTGTIAVQSITCGAFTGTLDFSANNNNVTLSAAAGMNASGAGTRTINLGNGTWSITGGAGSTPWNFSTITGLTFNANSSVINFSGATASAKTIVLGAGLAYSTIGLGANTSGGTYDFNSAGSTVATLNITAPCAVRWLAGITMTITNALSLTGSSSSQIFLWASANQSSTISSANNGTLAWCGVRDLTFAGGGTFTATNSFDLGHNSGITITAPSAGGSGGGAVFGAVGGVVH
jgi:hypothetical protein